MARPMIKPCVAATAAAAPEQAPPSTCTAASPSALEEWNDYSSAMIQLLLLRDIAV